MRIIACVIAIAVACVMQPAPLLAQDKQMLKRDRKAEQKRTSEQERRIALRQEIQPQVDRLGRRMASLEYQDPLASAYVNSLGQSLVPPEADVDATFSFRVIYDFRPNAFALPDGRVFVTTGLLASIENEAQLATVLGHEIAHVTEEHILDEMIRQRSSERRNNLIGAVAGAGLGGLLGGKKGGAGAAVAGAAAGTGLGLAVTGLTNSVMRAKFSREQEKEADLIGMELAMARGFDPEEGQRFFEKQHERYRKRRFRPFSAFLSSHPPSGVRATNISTLLSGELSPRLRSARASGELSTGAGQFGPMLSAMYRDNGILLAERTDRFDLARESLERAMRYRPRDPRVLWGLGRVYRLVGRTDEELALAGDLMEQAIQADQRNLYPAIHRDLAHYQAATGSDFAAATQSLQRYVMEHIATHRTLPADMEAVYDQLVLFGDNSWTPPLGDADDDFETAPVSVAYVPTMWDTPGRGISRQQTVGRSPSAVQALLPQMLGVHGAYSRSSTSGYDAAMESVQAETEAEMLGTALGAATQVAP